ncbi:MAG: acyl-CoA thioesterase [Pseudomonadales bacterium]|nr:acyl-CoA thioesterase [Pseudomonadales bacterium]
MTSIDDTPGPSGELALQTIAMPRDTNATGDIFGGWLLSQMDLAGSIAAAKLARGRVATVAIDRMSFMIPVKVGSVVSCHTEVIAIGRSSIQVQVEVWSTVANAAPGPATVQNKVTEGTFVYVAIDENRRTRPVPKSD